MAEFSIFKRIKKDLAASLLTVDKSITLGFADAAMTSDMLTKTRGELVKAEKYLKDLEIQYGILSGREKDHYKHKMGKLRQTYEAQRVRFFKLEDDKLQKSMGEERLNDIKS